MFVRTPSRNQHDTQDSVVVRSLSLVLQETSLLKEQLIVRSVKSGVDRC